MPPILSDSRGPMTLFPSALLALCLLWVLPCQAAGAEPSAFALEVPASFKGRLPCADCPGVLWHLDLWPERRFHLRREYVDREHLAVALGRWRYEGDGQRLVLQGAGQGGMYFSVVSDETLEMLDREGKAIKSDLNYALQRQGVFEAAEFPVSLTGTFRYFADAASFTDCATGYAYAVAMTGAYLDLERRYLSATATATAAGGAPWLVDIDAELRNIAAMEGEGRRQSLIINHFREGEGEACPDGEGFVP
ncbi:copper resistance protein NlpE N-terminal domain-containing protein [Congregibacter litoralis]|nr:copper resistance protein NlpE N-terminal domain-containing protein [Congregibacter litoralis]